MADVTIRDLVKVYPGQSRPATDEVSLDIRDGEFVVLLGPSGCGKTTLLRMLAGLEQPDSGQVVIGERDVTYLPPRDRRLSMVFQTYAIFPHRSVRQNIAFGLRMSGASEQVQDEKVRWAAGLLGLGDYLDRRPAQLSGGQRQRVAVARAIVVDADVLLMDEPLSNLDALLRISFRADLKRLVDDLGTTTVYVTHDQLEALSLGDRIAVMREGRIVQCGAATDVYDRPADRFVGSFLGSPPMSFLTGTVDAAGDRARVRLDSANDAGSAGGAGGAGSIGGAGAGAGRGSDDADGRWIVAPAGLAAMAGQRVEVGIRAEAVDVTGRQDGAVPAIVDVVEPTGSAVIITADVGGRPVKVQAPADTDVRRGDTVHLAPSTERLRWFDAESGAALEVA